MSVKDGIEVADKSINILKKIADFFNRKGYAIDFKEIEREKILCTEGLITEERKYLIESKRVFRKVHTFYHVFKEEMITSRLNYEWRDIAEIGNRYICINDPAKIVNQKKELKLEFRRELTQSECKIDVKRLEIKKITKEFESKFKKTKFDELIEININSRLNLSIKNLPISIAILRNPKYIYILEINNSNNFANYSKLKLVVPIYLKNDYSKIDQKNTQLEGEITLNIKEIEGGSNYRMYVSLSY